MLLCLIGKDGRSAIQYVPPVHDPRSARDMVLDICSRVDAESARVDCSLTPALLEDEAEAAGGSATPAVAVHRRFQSGQNDEMSFAAPELGPLAAVLVAPERGTWDLEELIISSSRSGHVDRFINRVLLGDARGAQPAVQLAPVAADAVLYGDQALSPRQARRVRQATAEDYVQLKSRRATVSTLYGHGWAPVPESHRGARLPQCACRILAGTWALVGIGSMLLAAMGGAAVAAPFFVGGVGGVVYQKLLQEAVDALAPAVRYDRKMRPCNAGFLRSDHLLLPPGSSLSSLGEEDALRPQPAGRSARSIDEVSIDVTQVGSPASDVAPD